MRPDLSTFPPRSDVVQLSFDNEATLLLVRLETQPSVVHLHTFLSSQSSSPEITHLAALVFEHPVRTARWCPDRRRVAVTTKTGGVYFWEGESGWIDDGSSSGDKSLELKGGTMEGVGIPTREYPILHHPYCLNTR